MIPPISPKHTKTNQLGRSSAWDTSSPVAVSHSPSVRRLVAMPRLLSPDTAGCSPHHPTWSRSERCNGRGGRPGRVVVVATDPMADRAVDPPILGRTRGTTRGRSRCHVPSPNRFQSHGVFEVCKILPEYLCFAYVQGEEEGATEKGSAIFSMVQPMSSLKFSDGRSIWESTS